MKKHYRRTASVVIIIAITLLSGCVTTYVPTDKTAQGISVSDAQQMLVNDLHAYYLLQDESVHDCHIEIGPVDNPTVWITTSEVDFTSTRMLIKSQTGDNKSDYRTTIFPLAEFPAFTASTRTDMNGATLTLPFPGGTVLCDDGIDAPKLANALYVLVQHAKAVKQEMASYDVKFQSQLGEYRNLIAAGTQLPERADMYRVQAEASVREKNFNQAQVDYGKALEVAPWWPQGHFNRALMFGATGDYDFAIMEMNHYLELVPNASNAREARYKTYDWQQKINEEDANIPAAFKSAQHQK